MSGHTPWSEISRKRQGNPSLQRGFRTAATASMWLAALRRHAGLTRAELAERLGVTQGWVSQIESEPDIRVSTVSAYVAALGAELQFRAVLPNGEELNLDAMPVDDPADRQVVTSGSGSDRSTLST
jgi:DNA-binding XRE family transcriptional regulator